MHKNFVVSNSIALESPSYYLDLHNCYLLSDIINEENTVILVFEKTIGDWVAASDPKTIELCFINVSCFTTSPNFNFLLPKGIEEMGYKSETDSNYDWLITEQKAVEKDHFVLRLVDDSVIRIFATEVKLVLIDP